jgi:hypothetical protein
LTTTPPAGVAFSFLALQGRRCYVRVWAVITSVDPLRLYVFKGGVAIFGDAPAPTTAATSQESTPDVPPGSAGSNASSDETALPEVSCAILTVPQKTRSSHAYTGLFCLLTEA